MLRTLLVPLDGSPFSAKALPVAADVARRTGAAVHIVTVVDPSAFVPIVPGEVLLPAMDTDALEARRTSDEAMLAEEVGRLKGLGINAVSQLLEGSVVETLAHHAEEIGADLIIMTTHGRSGFDRIWLGSVAMSFLHRAPCPVYLVRPSGEASPQADALLGKGPVLVTLDGTDFGDTIVAHAQEFAAVMERPISLFTVTTPNAIPMAPFGIEALLADGSDLTHQEEEASRRLKALAEELPPDTTTDVTTDMTAARAIIEKANEVQACMIAMATHGRTGIRRFVLGSCADSVLRGAAQPMLLYRPKDQLAS